MSYPPGQPVKWTACSLAPALPWVSTSAPTSSSATYREAAGSPLKGNTGQRQREPMMSPASQGPPCPCAETAAKKGHEVIWCIWSQSLKLLWGTGYQCWLQPRPWEALPLRHQVFTEQDPQTGNCRWEKRYLSLHCHSSAAFCLDKIPSVQGKTAEAMKLDWNISKTFPTVS